MAKKHRSPVAALAVVALAAFAVRPAVSGPQSAPDTASDLTVLITGANRGLGLEWARQWHARGATVIATARKPEDAEDLRRLGVRVEPLDVADPASVARLAERLGDTPLDVLINNAGIGGRIPSLAALDAKQADRVYQVNCLGPMRVTHALLPALRKGHRKLVVNISSRLGSLALNEGGSYYGYRESKAGLNMFTRSIAAELRPDGFTCIAMSPGWVRTDMGGPDAAIGPEESVAGMLKVLDGLTPGDTGRFLGHDGESIPW